MNRRRSRKTAGPAIVVVPPDCIRALWLLLSNSRIHFYNWNGKFMNCVRFAAGIRSFKFFE